MSNKNYYRVVNNKCDTILYSATPSSAAAKAFSKCFNKKSKSKVIKVQRRSGNKKIMSYRVKAIKNPKKMMVNKDGTMVHYNYRTKVKSLNKKRRSRSRR